MIGLLRDWKEKNGVSLEIAELTVDEADSMRMLTRGDIDAYVSLDSFGAQERVIPVSKIGSSDFYFVINNERPDLLAELNSALSAIQDEDPYYNQRLFDEYVQLTKTNAFLTPSLEEWLANHGTIRLGYLDDYLPFCDADNTTGALTGALKDYHNGEMMGVLTVIPIMKTEMSVLARTGDRPEIAQGKNLTVAIDEGNVNFETLIKSEIPDWTIKYYPSVDACCRAVAEGETDLVLASNYRMNDYEPLRIKYKLAALPSGETMGLSCAVNMDTPELYSILNKIANLSSSEDMEYALVSYMYSNQKVSFLDFLKDNWVGVLLFVTAVFAALLFLLYKKLNAERQVKDSLQRELEQKEQLKSVTRMAYTDDLTGVKSKHAFAEAEEKMDRRIEQKAVEGFAMVLFDLNDLKEINDSQGHEVGNQYIKEACRTICTRFKHSPVYRVGGDEFVAILEGADFENRDALLSAFDQQMDANLAQGKITIASGCAVFDPSADKSAHRVLERADEKMYQRKKQMKGADQ